VKSNPNRHTTMGNGKAKGSRRRREKRNNVKPKKLDELLGEVHNVEHEESRAKRSETDRGKAMVAALCLQKGLPVLRKAVKDMLEKIVESWEVMHGAVFRAMGRKRAGMFQLFQDFGVLQLLVDRLVGLVIRIPMKLIRLWSYSKDTMGPEDWQTNAWKKGMVVPFPHGRLVLDVSLGWMRKIKQEAKETLSDESDHFEVHERSIDEGHADCGVHEKSKEGAFEALGEYSKIASSPVPESKKAVIKPNVEEERILAVR